MASTTGSVAASDGLSVFVPRARDYDGAFEALLSTQSHGAVLEESAASRKHAIAIMTHYMERIGLDIESLAVVHVAGTKGKGSTCAFAESLLRAHGLTTGERARPAAARLAALS